MKRVPQRLKQHLFQPIMYGLNRLRKNSQLVRKQPSGNALLGFGLSSSLIFAVIFSLQAMFLQLVETVRPYAARASVGKSFLIRIRL